MPADTNSSLLGLLLQGTGNNDNSWGDNLNQFVFAYLETAVAGLTSIAVDGGSDNLTAGQHRNAILEFTGTLAADQTIVVDNTYKMWLVRNGTTGNFALKFKTASGSAVEIRQGGWCWVWCDGDDVVYVGINTAEFATQMRGPNGTVSLPGYSFASDSDTGWYRIGANNIGISCNGAKVLDIGTSGLGVTGNLTVSGAGSFASLTIGGETPVPIGAGLDYDGILAPNGWLFRYGQAVDRTTYALLLAKLTITAGSTRNGTTTLSSVDVDLTGLGLEGAKIEGSGITNGTTIVSLTSTTITLSQTASGSGSTPIRIFPHGNGDGATTFNIPDDRGRGNIGRDNMGGTAANRVTNAGSSIVGAQLGAVGGSQNTTLARSDLPNTSVTVTITDPGHQHVQTVIPAVGFAGGGNNGAIGGASSSTASATTGISAAFNLNGNVTQTTPSRMQPSRVSNKIIFTGVYS